MTRRILVAIMAVAIAAVAALGLPLGVVVQRLYRDEALARLERQATAATIEVPADFVASGDPLELPNGQDDVRYAVYLPDGHRVSGPGPVVADSVVRAATHGNVADRSTRSRTLVAVPVTSQEQVIAIVRASQSSGPLHTQVHRAWLAMSALAVVILAVAFALASGLARRLDRPVQDLVDAVTLLGAGDFSARAERSGVAELDRAADALDAAAARLGSVIERERAFTADASHQLRTPLTALRVHLAELEARGEPGDPALDRMGADVDRLEQTIEDLLHLARDTGPARAPVDLAALLAELDQAWHGRLAALGRPLVLRIPTGVPAVRASVAALRQILEVLVANACEHGAGTVTVSVREIGGGCAVDVADEGTGLIADPDGIFVRRAGAHPGRGIGLALARSLAEAEGGRLVLRDAGPRPTFTLLLPGPEEDAG